MQTRLIALVTAISLPLALGGFVVSSFAEAQPAAATPAAAQIDIHLGGQDQDAQHQARERGRHDGERAAHDDMHRGLSPDPNRHHEFRHPPVDHHLDDAYRDGFRHGYQDAFHHDGPH